MVVLTPAHVHRPPPNGALAIGGAAGIEFVAATRQGRRRADNQDAYAVHEGPPLRIGVFDGVASRPDGARAAQAAAAALPQAGRDILGDLDAAVRRTAGCATAAVAEIRGTSATLHWIGDCQAYSLADEPRPLLAPHRAAGGPVTQALGFGGRGQTIVVDLEHPLLLCTDGLPRAAISQLAGDLQSWAQRLLERAEAVGADDDLTFVVLRHPGSL